MKKHLVFFLLAIFSIQAQAQVTEHVVEPVGVYKEINVNADNELLVKLVKSEGKAKENIVADIISKPNVHIPSVLYGLSFVLFRDGKKNEASFWFYVAQLRIRYDFNRCADKTTAGPLAGLNQMFGPQINEYAIKNFDELEATVERVVDFVRSNPEEYDQRWLNLSGMGAMTTSLDNKKDDKPLSLPEKDWPEIKKKTVDNYYSAFKDAIARMRAKKN